MRNILRTIRSGLPIIALPGTALFFTGPASARAPAHDTAAMFDTELCKCKAQTPAFSGKNGWTFGVYTPFLINGDCTALDTETGQGCNPMEDFDCLFGGSATFTKSGQPTQTMFMTLDAPNAANVECGKRGFDNIDMGGTIGVVGAVNTNCLSCSTTF